jgi:hypothetical protein
MNKMVVFLIVITISTVCFAANDANWVSLSGSDCKDAISQRSHSKLPSGFQLYKLSDSICLKIEAVLPNILDSLNKLNQSEKSSSYKRQYFGITKNGKNYAYVNLFPVTNDSFGYWRKRPALVKDGGQSFCGLLIDIDKMVVIEIACNGDA